MLFLGRIMKEKGVDELFEAAKNLKKQYGERILFGLAGFFEEGYRGKVERLSKDGILSFYGFRQDPRPLYEAAHVVVLSSYHEGMSNVLLEAAATGRALITSDIPGCRESVEDGKNGYLCRAGDAESLEQAIRKFMQQKRKTSVELKVSKGKYYKVRAWYKKDGKLIYGAFSKAIKAS